MNSLGQFNVQYYLQYGFAILSRRRWLVFLSFFLVLSGATAVSYTLPDIYKSSITILIETGQVINPLTKGLGVSSEMEERLRTVPQGITNRSLIEKVIKKINLDINVKTPEEFEGLIQAVRRNLIVTRPAKSLFTITYHGKDPVKVKEVVSTVVDMYIEENLSVKRSEANEAFDFINEQLQLYKKKLEESEKTLREFKEANLKDLQYTRGGFIVQQEGEVTQIGGPVVGGLLGGSSQNANLARLEAYQASLANVNQKLKDAYEKLAQLKTQLEIEEPMIVTFSAESILVDPTTTTLGKLEDQLATLLTRYTEQHPDVIRLKNQIEDLKKRLVSSESSTKAHTEVPQAAQLNPVYQHLTQEITNTEGEIASLERQRSDLQKKIEEYGVKVKAIPFLEQEHIRLTRDYDVNAEIYQTLLQRLETARVTRELEVKEKGSTFKIVEPAKLPLKPEAPNRLLIILMGLIGGLGTGVGLAGLVEFSKQPFNSQKEVETYLGMPVLITIPKIFTDEDRKRRKRSNQLMIALCGLYLLVTGGVAIWHTLQTNPAYFQSFIEKFQNLAVVARETFTN